VYKNVSATLLKRLQTYALGSTTPRLLLNGARAGNITTQPSEISTPPMQLTRMKDSNEVTACIQALPSFRVI